jgi:biotin transporter BioY
MIQSKILLGFLLQMFIIGLLIGKSRRPITVKTVGAVYGYFFIFYAILTLFLKNNPDLFNPWLKYGISLYNGG